MLKYNCNDYFQYLYRSSFDGGIRDTKAFREERKKQIRECNHEFVMLKEGGWNNCGGFDSSDYVYDYNVIECVHCGITNKYKEIERVLNEPMEYTFISHPTIRKTVETEEFDLYFGNNYSDMYDVNLISPTIIKSKHTRLLYEIAKTIYGDADNEKLVNVMHKLILLETNEEKMCMNTIDDAHDLIIRYCSFMNKVLTAYKCSSSDEHKLIKRKIGR